jgi:hypothetical protein
MIIHFSIWKTVESFKKERKCVLIILNVVHRTYEKPSIWNNDLQQETNDAENVHTSVSVSGITEGNM